MNKRCRICNITQAELIRQRRYNNRTIPCTSATGRHRYAWRKPDKINPNQLAITQYFANIK